VAFISELQRDFDVKQVELSATKSRTRSKVLVVIHPKEYLTPLSLRSNQFVLRGGQLIAFVDPFARWTGRRFQTEDCRRKAVPRSTNCSKPGCGFASGESRRDLEYAAQMRGERNPTVLALNETAVNKRRRRDGRRGQSVMAFSGGFSGSSAAGLTRTDLLKSSKRSQLVDAMMASFGAAQIANDFKASGTEYPLASVWPVVSRPHSRRANRSPPSRNQRAETEEKPADKSFLKESAQPTTVVLVGDADMIQNEVGGARIADARWTAADHSDEWQPRLRAGRSRTTGRRQQPDRRAQPRFAERPFTVVQKMQADAEGNYRSKIKELETSLSETQRKVNELQRSKDAGQRFILSPEQQQELANFRKTEGDVKTQLKEMRRKLRAKIDSLENRIKWINIAGMRRS